MVDFTLWDIFRNLLLAARWTVGLSLIAFIGGGLVALLLLIARLSKARGTGVLVSGYVQLFQGTPLLMQLFLAYFGIALFGVKTSAWTAAAMALTLYTSAYLTEIWRGCVASIPKGQWEAGQSLAMNFGEQLRHVVLPQAQRPPRGWSLRLQTCTCRFGLATEAKPLASGGLQGAASYTK